MATSKSDSQVKQLAEMVRESSFTVALTGAGISVPSGIPDFRSPGTGVWEKVDPMEVASISAYRSDPKRFWSFYRPRFGMLKETKPNGAHLALAELEKRELLQAVITQNIDLLHRKAGSRNLVEVHGSIETTSCTGCGKDFELKDVEGLFDDEGVPRCTECGGPCKPDVVLFGETLPEDAINSAFELAGRAGLMLCVGSSLEVHPVAMLPAMAKRAGGRLAIVTQGSTPYDDEADVRLSGDVVDDLQALVEAL